MLEVIKQKKLRDLAEYQQMEAQETAIQIERAKQEVVAPKTQEFEEQRRKQLENAQTEYTNKCTAISNSIDLQERTFEDTCVQKVTKQCADEFKDVILELKKELQQEE
ncbi:MAG: hypothetical protein RR454_03120 [Clostridia bacterium]